MDKVASLLVVLVVLSCLVALGGPLEWRDVYFSMIGLTIGAFYPPSKKSA